MTLMHPTRSDAPDHAWLIATHLGDTPRAEVEDSLRELRALADTAQAGILGETVCRLRDIHPATYIGRGKATQIAEEAAAAGATLVIFDDDLSPAQGRALEDLFKIRVVDRTQLILDIFAQRALSLEGRLQIELAQLRYLIPRLRGLWTHLERQKGGIGLKGPGEKQLELDRRRIEQRITRIKAQLQIVRLRRAELRRGRRRHGWALLTLVGYTNAGKSTLLNTLTEAGVHADDQLFATLEEVNEADLLLHVIDASQPRVDEQIAAVEAVLRELGAEAKPVLAVFNKTDLEKGRNQAIRLADRFRNSVAISAATGEGTGTLCQAIADLLRDRVAHLHLKIPAGEGRWIAALHANGKVLEQKVRGKQLHIEAVVSASFAATLPPDWIVS